MTTAKKIALIVIMRCNKAKLKGPEGRKLAREILREELANAGYTDPKDMDDMGQDVARAAAEIRGREGQ